MTQITTIDELRSMHGQSVWIVKKIDKHVSGDTVVYDPRKPWPIGMSYAHIIPWLVGKIFDVNDPKSPFILYRRLGNAFCLNQRDLMEGGLDVCRIVWLDAYLHQNIDNDLSGIFTTPDEAKTRVALIRLTSEFYATDYASSVDQNDIEGWCQIVWSRISKKQRELLKIP